MIGEAYPVWFADRAWHGPVSIQQNVQIARDTYRVRFDCPQIARRIVPGQFVMSRLAGCDDPLLGRPLALYDTVLDSDGRTVGLELVYFVAGKFTSRLSRLLPGQQLEVWGPLGNGFPPQACQHLIMVAGGIGQTPFLALARERLGLDAYGDPPRESPRVGQISLCYGVRSAAYLAGVADFEQIGVRVRTSTDDGTAGRQGLVTDLLAELLDESADGCRVVCCGPEPMMAAVARLAGDRHIPCQLSLESPMACGVGICFSCVAKIRDPSGGWDYRRTCVEGPVFDAAAVDFS